MARKMSTILFKASTSELLVASDVIQGDTERGNIVSGIGLLPSLPELMLTYYQFCSVTITQM